MSAQRPARATITLDFKGDSFADISEFARRLQLLKEALAEFDREISPGSKVIYKLIDVQHHSPYECLVEEEVVYQDNGRPVGASLKRVAFGVSYIKEHQLNPPGFTLQQLRRLEALTEGVGDSDSDRLNSVGFKLEHESKLVLDQEFKRFMTAAIGPDVAIWGGIRGRLEFMNVHSIRKTCYIYPRVGPERVKCTFPARLRSAFVDAFDNYVSVFGKLKYKSMEDFPHEIAATEAPYVLGGSDVETMLSLKGAAPTGQADSSSIEPSPHPG